MIYIITANTGDAESLIRRNNIDVVDSEWTYVASCYHIMYLRPTDIVVFGRNWENRTDSGLIRILTQKTQAYVFEED